MLARLPFLLLLPTVFLEFHGPNQQGQRKPATSVARITEADQNDLGSERAVQAVVTGNANAAANVTIPRIGPADQKDSRPGRHRVARRNEGSAAGEAPPP